MQIRPIKSEYAQGAEDEGKKRNVKILGIFLLLILAVSSIGYAFLSSDNQMETTTDDLKEGVVIEQNGRWVAKAGGQIIAFSSSPESIANITDSSTLGIGDYYQQSVFYAEDGNALSYELSQNIGIFAKSIQPACYGPCSLDIPEKNCTDKLIIWNRNSTINKVYQQDNCVFIDGDIRAVDAFLYRAFGLRK